MDNVRRLAQLEIETPRVCCAPRCGDLSGRPESPEAGRRRLSRGRRGSADRARGCCRKTHMRSSSGCSTSLSAATVPSTGWLALATRSSSTVKATDSDFRGTSPCQQRKRCLKSQPHADLQRFTGRSPVHASVAMSGQETLAIGNGQAQSVEPLGAHCQSRQLWHLLRMRITLRDGEAYGTTDSPRGRLALS